MDDNNGRQTLYEKSERVLNKMMREGVRKTRIVADSPELANDTELQIMRVANGREQSRSEYE